MDIKHQLSIYQIYPKLLSKFIFFNNKTIKLVIADHHHNIFYYKFK